jgi:radical SAM protein with 4Fe4S-binding SPASM domain
MIEHLNNFLNYFRQNKPDFSKISGDAYHIKIKQNNYRRLNEIIENVKNKGGKQIIFEMADNPKEIVEFKDLTGPIYSAYEKCSKFFQISFKNFPLCILKNLSNFAFCEKKEKWFVSDSCDGCRAKNICCGVSNAYRERFGLSELRCIPDIPSEVVIEVEPKCNFNCNFCFNKLSFASEGRNHLESLSKDYVKKIVEAAADAKIGSIRFTGGEPLLHPDILELLDFAKSLNFAQVRLNTNGSLIDRKFARRLVQSVDNFLIPLESSGGEKEREMCGGINVFELKLSAIRFLKEAGAGMVRIGTVATKSAIEDFEQIEILVSSLGADRWELFRPIPFTREGDIINRNDVEILVAKLIHARRKERNQKYLIANALPFCAVREQNSINSVSMGSLFDDGHSRFVVDPRGFAKPHYFIDENIGDPLDPLSCWQHPFMKKMRTLQFLPSTCRSCYFRFKCRGGSRKTAMLVNGSYDAIDPLAKANS